MHAFYECSASKKLHKIIQKNEPCSLCKKRSLWSNKESLAFCLAPLYYPRLHHWIYYKSCTENEFTLIHFRILGILKQLCVYAFLICIKNCLIKCLYLHEKYPHVLNIPKELTYCLGNLLKGKFAIENG